MLVSIFDRDFQASCIDFDVQQTGAQLRAAKEVVMEQLA